MYRFKLTEHAASIAVQMERHAAALEVDLPTDWRRTLETTDDGALVNEMMRFVGGQLQVLRPRVLKFYEAGWNSMLALQQDDSNELDSVLDSIGIPREAASGRSVLERVNSLNEYFLAIMDRPG